MGGWVQKIQKSSKVICERSLIASVIIPIINFIRLEICLRKSFKALAKSTKPTDLELYPGVQPAPGNLIAGFPVLAAQTLYPGAKMKLIHHLQTIILPYPFWSCLDQRVLKKQSINFKAKKKKQNLRMIWKILRKREEKKNLIRKKKILWLWII